MTLSNVRFAACFTLGVLLTIGALLTIGVKAAAPRVAATDDPKPAAKSFAEIVKDRPPPDLAKLVARSSPKISGDDATESFYDILKLRDSKDEKAVPVLGQILDENLTSGRIHGYAAAQALFCIGTPEALAILDKQLLTNRYGASGAIKYINHWDMDSSKARSFVERYHLKNVGDALRVRLDAPDEDDNQSPVRIVLTIQNVSKQSQRIIRPEPGSNRKFLFQDVATGRLLTDSPRTECFGRSKWVNLAPGEKEVIEEEVPRDELTRMWGDPQLVPPGGRVRIYLIFEQRPLEPTKDEPWRDTAWTGRAVSNPVEITLPK